MKVSEMYFLHSVKLLLLWTFIFTDGAPLVNVTYEELEELGASCNNLDNCKTPRHRDMLTFQTCHCGSYCAYLFTCCIDSPYRDKENRRFQLPCKKPYGMENVHYFIRDRCSINSVSGGIFEKLCKNTDAGDLLSLVPVTSLSTNVTYRNYFCFKCNERGDNYRYWNIGIFGDAKFNNKRLNNNILTYSSVNKTWVAPIGEGGSLIPVTFSVDVPSDIEELPKKCVPNVISRCSEDWKDGIIRQKCDAYTSIVHFIKDELTVSYRNPHCALCNFENLKSMLCALGITDRTGSKKPFSFSFLLDINPSDGELVGKVQQCDGDAMWDPFFKKCRVLKCAIPDYVIENGECKPP